MACTLKHGFHVSCLSEVVANNASKTVGNSAFCPSHALTSDFIGRNKNLVVSHQQGASEWDLKFLSNFSVRAQAATCVSRALRWWEKSVGPNMVEIKCAEELVDALRGAGDKLVVVDFYSPGCGGCKALHPKICQLAEWNPDAIFLKIKKFKDALTKHGTKRCAIGPAKGLDDIELIKLAELGEISPPPMGCKVDNIWLSKPLDGSKRTLC